MESYGEDWEFCEGALRRVSRSFSKPIALLPERLRVGLTCGYLLCRVVDTIEDDAELPLRERDRLFSLFVDVLYGHVEPERLSSEFAGRAGSDEVDLVRQLPRVLRVFERQPPAVRQRTVHWTIEMAQGMRLYCHRDVSGELNAVGSVADLERYCYFVAGTVGQLITDLFLDWMAHATEEISATLRQNCESFGIGLQMVNILKDVTDDFARQRCYVPTDLCLANGLPPSQLLREERRAQAHRSVRPLFCRAATHLKGALDYSLAIPPEHAQLRVFCLLPLWMAMETLILAAGNDAMFTPGAPVKITRDEVSELARHCLTNASNSDELRRAFAGFESRLHYKLRALTPGDQEQREARYAQA